jgi:LysM repeat protein
MKPLKFVLVLVVLFTLIGGPVQAVSAASTQPHRGVSNPCGEFYTVRWGDTLAKIAARCNSTVAILMRANPQVANPDRIVAGQRLNILPRGVHVPVFKQVQIFLIGPGNQNCGTPIAVVRHVRPTTAPLTAAIQELITLKGEYYGESGLFNPLHRSNLSIETVTLVNGKATIRLTGTLRVDGACHGANIKTVFDRTALQFSTVKSAKVFINGRPLVDILSEEA